MKRISFILVFFGLAVVSSLTLQSCACLCGDEKSPVGVIQFDSTNLGVIIGYDWSNVDTTGGFTTMPTGFKAAKNGNYGTPILEEKQIKWVEGMLITFQKQFKVKVTSYQIVPVFDNSQAYVRVFFELEINPTIQKLEDAYQESIDQNQKLNNLVNDLSSSNWQMKKEFKQLKKSIEEKK
ncbi:MAG: hypothetical protein WAZ12_05505 [Candidatus Absconditicoccaceae bacterium]